MQIKYYFASFKTGRYIMRIGSLSNKVSIRRVYSSNFNENALAELSIKVDHQTYSRDNPDVLVNVSGLQGRSAIWRAALSDPMIYVVGAYITCTDRQSSNKEMSMIGFLSGRLGKLDSSSILGSIYVLPEYQHLGYGTLLLYNFVNLCLRIKTREIVGSVPFKSNCARDFFYTVGFKEGEIFVVGDYGKAYEKVQITCADLAAISRYMASK